MTKETLRWKRTGLTNYYFSSQSQLDLPKLRTRIRFPDCVEDSRLQIYTKDKHRLLSYLVGTLHVRTLNFTRESYTLFDISTRESSALSKYT